VWIGVGIALPLPVAVADVTVAVALADHLVDLCGDPLDVLEGSSASREGLRGGLCLGRRVVVIRVFEEIEVVKVLHGSASPSVRLADHR